MVIDRTLLEKAAELVVRRTGLHSPESHHSHLHRILMRMSRQSGSSPAQVLEEIPRQEALYQDFINQAMIGETYFFREEGQFHLLINDLLPSLARLRREQPVRLWSASCSTGEEAVSLAAAARSVLPAGAAFEVYASDINRASLETLKKGLYRSNSFRRDGASFHPLLGSPPEKHQQFTVDPLLLGTVRIHHLNLHQDSLDALPDGMDVVFFRNTMIYAPVNIRRQMVRRIAEKISPGGYFFTAASEAPFVDDEDLVLREQGGVHFFQRKPADLPERKVKKAVKEPERPRRESPRDEEALLEALMEAARRKDDREGLSLLGKLESFCSSRHDYLLLTGWFYRSLGEKAAARQAFRQATLEESPSWVSYYYLGELTLKDSLLESESALRQSRKLADQKIPLSRSQQKVISLVCEGFSPEYFHHLSAGWIKQLEDQRNEGGPHGSR